jgi:hypothetical protein
MCSGKENSTVMNNFAVLYHPSMLHQEVKTHVVLTMRTTALADFDDRM